MAETMEAIITNEYGLLRRTVRFLTGSGFGMGARLSNVNIPRPDVNELRVKVTAVALCTKEVPTLTDLLNPSDNLHVDLVGNPGSIVGCDFCGEVVEIGTSVAKDWKVGQRVAGVVHGGMTRTEGSYAEYLVTPSDLVWIPPESITDQEAATFGVSAVTAMLALYTELSIPWPGEQQSRSTPSSIFIYAGSASASLFVIQLATLAGLTVITTCSQHNFELVKSYGADFVYDYRSASVLDEILRAHPDIDKAFDGLSNQDSTTFCAKVVKPSNGKVVVLLDTVKAARRLGIDVSFIMMYSAFGKDFAWLPPVGPAFPANTDARDALVRFYGILPSLLDRVKPLPTKELDKGLVNIPKNLTVLKAGVSGSKLTMRL